MKKDMTKEKVVITETVTRYPSGLWQKIEWKGPNELEPDNTYIKVLKIHEEAKLEWAEADVGNHAVVSSYLSANPGTASSLLRWFVKQFPSLAMYTRKVDKAPMHLIQHRNE